MLNHDEIAVDDDAEIDRPEAQQIGGHSRGVHAREGKQQRQRNGDRRQQGRAETPQRQREHDDDDDQCFGQGAGDRAQRVRDQVGPIVDADHPRTLGQPVGVEIVDGVVNRLQHLAGVLPPAHQDGSLDAADATVQPEDAGLRRGAHRDAADVLEQDRHARFGRQGDVFDIRE